MKKDIHPKYHQKATVKCACGNEFTIGATQEKIETEICSQCHPFYTGAKRGAVSGGRIEKFEAKLKKKSDYKPKKQKKAEKRRKKQAQESTK